MPLSANLYEVCSCATGKLLVGFLRERVVNSKLVKWVREYVARELLIKPLTEGFVRTLTREESAEAERLGFE